MTSPSIEKIIGDPVHGFMDFSPEMVKFIDTPQFQRLRNLHQLGTASYVFPGASHTRFEHSLGVAHIANTLVSRLSREQPELKITEKDRNLVTIAGLCHDLGHGPFSHVFEDWINSKPINQRIPFLKSSVDLLNLSSGEDFSVGIFPRWDHEEMSCKMLRSLIDENELDTSDQEIKVIEDLITGSRKSSYFQGKEFLFDIIHNQKNGLDVDKFDYLERDCYHLGLKSSYDYTRLLHSSRVIENQLCYPEKTAFHVYSLFATRYNLHKQIYQHEVTLAVDYMVRDILREADFALKISEQARNVEDFLYINDSLLTEIGKSKTADLASSRAILRRLEKRDLYKMAGELILTRDQWTQFSKYLTSEYITSSISSCQVTGSIHPEDLIVSLFKIDYSMGCQNPVLSVPFYSKNHDSSFTIPQSEVSLLLPTHFEEYYCRVYVRNPILKKEVETAFKSFQSHLLSFR